MLDRVSSPADLKRFPLSQLSALAAEIRQELIDIVSRNDKRERILEPGSAEMPSAGRALTAEVVTDLVAHGIVVAPIVLHTGVASLEAHETPYPERYHVPAVTARLVNVTHAAGGIVVAVGTTVVRALETVVDDSGTMHPGSGWTELVITPERGVRVVDGLLTGWHEPEASHLRLLEAVAGREALRTAYAEALGAGYHWHEFGDVHLILPER